MSGRRQRDVNNEERLKKYVANRVKKILEATDPCQWRHVPGEQNPADCISRGRYSVDDLLSTLLYWFGPRFLYLSPELWPGEVVEYTPDEEAEKELMENNKIDTEDEMDFVDDQELSRNRLLQILSAGEKRVSDIMQWSDSDIDM